MTSPSPSKSSSSAVTLDIAGTRRRDHSCSTQPRWTPSWYQCIKSLPPEHGIELFRDLLEQFLDCCQVSDEGWPGNFRYVVTPGMVIDTRWFRSLYVRSNVPLILMVIKWNQEDIVKLPQQLHPLYYYYILIALKVSLLPIKRFLFFNSVLLQIIY